MSLIRHDIESEYSVYDGVVVYTRTADGRQFIGKGRSRREAIYDANQKAESVDVGYEYPLAPWERKVIEKFKRRGIQDPVYNPTGEKI